MTDLNQALIDIRSIRRQVANVTEFRGYGPLTLSATAALALLGGLLNICACPSQRLIRPSMLPSGSPPASCRQPL